MQNSLLKLLHISFKSFKIWDLKKKKKRKYIHSSKQIHWPNYSSSEVNDLPGTSKWALSPATEPKKKVWGKDWLLHSPVSM